MPQAAWAGGLTSAAVGGSFSEPAAAGLVGSGSAAGPGGLLGFEPDASGARPASAPAA